MGHGRHMKKFIKLTLVVTLVVSGIMLGVKFKNFQDATNRQTTFAVHEPFFQKVKAHIYKITKRSSVYEFLRKSYYTFGVPRKGLIHIGARAAEELEHYQEHKLKDILWIEADPAAEPALREAVKKHPGSKIAMVAIADQTGSITLHRTTNTGHSSSILKLKNHLQYYPYIQEADAIEVPSYKLDDFLSAEQKQQYNVLVMDIQGAELYALKGATETLKHIDAIIAEVNFDELYENCVLMPELDKFLQAHGFVRVDTISVAYYTGDALYIKDKQFSKGS